MWKEILKVNEKYMQVGSCSQHLSSLFPSSCLFCWFFSILFHRAVYIVLLLIAPTHARLYVNGRKDLQQHYVTCAFVLLNPLERKRDCEAGVSAPGWEWLVLLCVFFHSSCSFSHMAQKHFTHILQPQRDCQFWHIITSSTHYCCLA